MSILREPKTVDIPMIGKPRRARTIYHIHDPLMIRSLVLVLLILTTVFTDPARAANPPVVEIEEPIYTYSNAQNGAGPMWCTGSTTIVRVGDRVFASGLETVPGARPLNNCRWMLFARDGKKWTRVYLDDEGRTREPSPVAAFADGRVFVSANPTLAKSPEANGGPARPEVFEFKASDPKITPATLTPVWQGTPLFREHSYRSFVADGSSGELLLMQNIDYAHAEWSFLSRAGQWTSRGKIVWPVDDSQGKSTPLRLCYPNVALRNRATHFAGVSDVVEPNEAWRKFKHELTGQGWDYTFRRLNYSWTPDITKQPFAPWIELANREATAGYVQPGDLWIAPNGDAHIVWSERVTDARLREKFLPKVKQGEQLNYAVIRSGKVLRRHTLMESAGESLGISGSACRLQITPDDRLFAVYRCITTNDKGARTMENRVAEILPNGVLGESHRIPLEHPFYSFFTATPRAGSPPSWTLDMLGEREGTSQTISYTRVNLAPLAGTHSPTTSTGVSR